MTIAYTYMKLMDAIPHGEDGRLERPYFDDIVSLMRRDASDTERTWERGALDPDERFIFPDGSGCTLHNPDQAVYAGYINGVTE